jgi:hypothetical protein
MLATGTLGVLFPTARGLLPTNRSRKISRYQPPYQDLSKAKLYHLFSTQKKKGGGVKAVLGDSFDEKQALHNFS